MMPGRRRRQLDNKISSKQVDEALETAKRAGAWGGKVCGAGAGGHLLVMGPPALRDTIQHAVAAHGYRPRKFSLDAEGVRIVPVRDA